MSSAAVIVSNSQFFSTSEIFFDTVRPLLFRLFPLLCRKNRLGCVVRFFHGKSANGKTCTICITVGHWVPVLSPCLSFLSVHFVRSPIGKYLLSRVPVGLGIVAVPLLSWSWLTIRCPLSFIRTAQTSATKALRWNYGASLGLEWIVSGCMSGRPLSL